MPKVDQARGSLAVSLGALIGALRALGESEDGVRDMVAAALGTWETFYADR